MFKVPERYRWKNPSPGMESTAADGNNGVFSIPNGVDKERPSMRCIVSDGMEWDHVSVSMQFRCPTWEEMNYIKSLFWDKEDCVIQYHPPESEYVNQHPYCLHLWRPQAYILPMPPSVMVGQK